MIGLITGSFLLSLLHAAIPNHWLPLVFIGRSERWSTRETLWVAGLAGLAHSLSTIGLGVILGQIGLQLAGRYQAFTTVVAPLILILMGLLYVGLGAEHTHQHLPRTKGLTRKPKWAIVGSISVAMFFSPCLEIEGFYLTAGVYGWPGILTISLVYLLVTVSGIMGLVALGGRGLEKANWHWIEHHEKKITGFTLMLLGMLTFFIH